MSKKDALIQPDRGQNATTIHLVTKDGFEDWLKPLSAGQRAAVKAQKFVGKPAQVAIVPDGDEWFAAGGVSDLDKLTSWCLAKLAEDLPEGTYRLQDREPGAALHGWQTAQYKFTRYVKPDESAPGPRVLLSQKAKHLDDAIAEAEAENLVRDLVNTPAEDMGPAQLEAECEKLAKAYDAKLKVVKGDALEKDYPMIHAVGRAAARHHAPRLMRLEWGNEKHPKLAIVGKGVCFDSGGLDIKPASGMKLMKKDMGGAAHAIALARLVMDAKLPVRLQLLIPAVENAIAGNSFRPGDILKTRKGLTVEIGNTDAEGRLILGDALTRASEDDPDFIVDFATLTGAARVALGPDLPALMTRKDETAQALIEAGKACDDEPWRLPLPEAYREWLKSDVADMNNISNNPFAGASVAGLFLDKFVSDGIDWAHFDTFAWRPSAKPGRPAGGAAYGLRATFHMLRSRYAGN
ncbi:leucyl aminopeptidase family protein [Altererythrobacter sp.]|uniref:leucyl aminopeptidase family protein n=1 Tax=Altererythrobacter sp. TaxID=1872480 RepID=UPI001B1A1829|nr:leucyl aminopeptidase family protein [Altererythrobacter sp.]MBO6608820.1 leucyl aminopeptidase family protein [Altererythrobacter sp.]MBO6640860.1 leucyl aminopeptidase family protein [Altererythrobacter sp.]MBO6708442.1 leucyl aminopeptidase family protein [Altererythrobacter sp.]MBO6945421.1 leucyl aminopeptidase family protein [Altererythrobacter sp.]